MADQFDRLIPDLLGAEGGYVNNPDDAGGETNWGVTRLVALQNGYSGPMALMTRDQAIAIYRARYWAGPRLDLLSPISSRVTAEVFDAGVNMGPAEAAIMLQRVLNVLNRQGRDYPDVKVDGAIGPATAAALKSFMTVRGVAGESVLLKALNCLRGARYIELAEADQRSETFVYGWLANRVTLA